MTTNLALRIVGLLLAIVMLCLAKVLTPLWLVLTFLTALSVHVVAGDAFGDKFFTDEPFGVAITRWAGYGAAMILGTISMFVPLPLKLLVPGFVGSLATHLVGDALSVKDSIMAFDIGEYVVLYPFLGWVGLGVMLMSFLLGHQGHMTHVWFFGVGFMLSATGNYGSYRIYTDGNDPAAHEPVSAPKS